MIARRLLTIFCCASLTLSAGGFITSCGGGSGSIPESSQGIRGVLLAPDGQTPVAGATVYVPGGSTAGVSIMQTGNCEPPPEDYIAWTCTAPDGSFVLDITPTNTVTLKFKKGVFQLTVTVSPNNTNIGSVSLPSDPAQGAPKMAVITGSWDRMEDVLAKLGFGNVNDYGQLVVGTERFDLYDGNNSLSDADYPDFPAIFDDNDGDSKPDIYNYDIVFINCGNSYENLLDSTKVNILRQYVQQGGRLYITDLSYDFVEQVFPEFIDFYGSDSTPETNPENIGAAEVGDSGITSEADVLDTTLKEWLKEVSCKELDYTTYPPTEIDVPCIDPATEKVHIEGFLSGWAVINGPHPGQTSNVKVWVKGPVSWYDGGNQSGVKPLTVSFTFGNGKVLYTSYHTESTNIKGFIPQERILQYLVFF